MRGRRAAAGALGCVLLLALASCGSDEADLEAAPSPASTSAPPEPGPEPSAPAGDAAPMTVVDAADTAFFQAPSGNIACSLAGEAASCDIQAYSYTPPETPADCELDFGAMLSVGIDGPASFLCHGDTNAVGDQTLPNDLGTLPYGEQLSNGVFTCSSSERGMSCATADGTHGFELSRADYRVF